MKINEIETKRQKKKEKSMKPRVVFLVFFLENVKKTDKPEATLTKVTENSGKIRNENGEITTDTTEIQRIRGCTIQ